MRNMKVNRNEGDNSFCGPAALSIVTGKPVSEITALLRYLTGKRAIKGVYNSTMEQALLHYGFGIRYVHLPIRQPTLAGWLKNKRATQDVFLLNTTRHFIVVRGRKIADNCNPEGVFLRKYAHRRVRVRRVWHVVQSA